MSELKKHFTGCIIYPLTSSILGRSDPLAQCADGPEMSWASPSSYYCRPVPLSVRVIQ